MYSQFLFIFKFYLVSYFPPLIDILVYLPEVRLRAEILNITSQYITASTTHLYQFIGQCRSRNTLRLNIEEAHGV